VIVATDPNFSLLTRMGKSDLSNAILKWLNQRIPPCPSLSIFEPDVAGKTMRRHHFSISTVFSLYI